MRSAWLKSPYMMKATTAAARAAASVSTSLAGLIAARLWFTPWTVPLSERARAHQSAWLAGSRQRRFSTRAGRVAGFVAGESGPSVLLVHGWGERIGDMGAFIAPLRDSGFRVIGIDLPAHGKSPGAQTNLLDAADAIADVAGQVADVRAVIAHSMGAAATMTAITQGLTLDCAVLLAPAVRLESAIDKFGFLYGLPPRALQGLRETIERRFGATVWDDLAADRMASSFDLPALIVHDQDDPQIDPADSELLAGAWNGATLEKTTGLGHGRIVRDQRVLDLATRFIAGHVHSTQGSAVLSGKATTESLSTAS